MITHKKVRFEDLFPIIQEKISSGDSFTFCAFGVSMLPFIRNGKDLVTLGPIHDALSKNDIIFYRRENGQFVLHRIVKVCADGSYNLCGDNQFRIEKGIRKSQIIAKLDRLERNGKEISSDSLFSKIWCFFLPIRRFILHVKRSVMNRVKKRFQK